MNLRIPMAILALCSLCACDPTGYSDLSGYNVELDSESCRALAADKAGEPAPPDGTADEKQAAYDHAYRACMADKGYALTDSSRTSAP